MTENIEDRDASPEVLMKMAVRQVDRLTRRRRRDLILQWAVLILVLALGGLTIDQVHQNTVLSSQNYQLAAAAYQACLNGNGYRAGEQQLWTDFITLALASSKDKQAAQRIVAPFEKQIAIVDAPRHCPSLAP